MEFTELIFPIGASILCSGGNLRFPPGTPRLRLGAPFPSVRLRLGTRETQPSAYFLNFA